MNQQEQKMNAKEFVERWRGRGDEKQDAQSYWRDLLVNVLGVPSTTLANFVSFERKVRGGGFIDAFIEDTGVLIEQKSLGTDLSKKKTQSDGAELTPYEQAVRYSSRLPLSIRPRWIITSNFDQILVYDQESDPSGEHPFEIRLEDLPTDVHRLAFITDQSNSRLEKERELSVRAGEVVGRLYSSFSSQYRNLDADPHEQRSLNILIVHLVFLLYAEDAGLLHERGALYNYLKPIPVPQTRQALIDLFKVLDTPDGSAGTEDKRDPYMAKELLDFPYINGGLFAEEGIVIPQFTEQIKLDLLLEASSKFDWSEVSPTIFGAVFESTLNSETRRAGGMHYTSIENIHKVIDPLFLDDLRKELESIETLKSDRDRKIRLKAFQKKLASVKILDPACGSGNFLTESYLSLRKLENRVIENLAGEQMGIGFEGEANPIQVSLSQFYGIEINDFAVSVAKTALWIAESQMIEATQEIVLQVFDFLPLKSNSNIVEGNALRMDWNDVLPANECSYIIGNPPFLGAKIMSKEQKQEVVDLFGKVKLANSIDYVSAWYVKAARQMELNPSVRSAFVSTNSICQGQQVMPVWSTLMRRYGIRIDFAHRSFIWNSEATEQAHVHVVIVGFSRNDGIQIGKRILFNGDSSAVAENINPYLTAAPDVIVDVAAAPICRRAKECDYGSLINDGGNYIFKPDELEAFLAKDPRAEKFVRPLLGSDELIKGKERFVLYLRDITEQELDCMPEVRKRVAAVREQRAGSSAAATRKTAATPTRFYFDSTTESRFLVIPSVSSERRSYVPMDFKDADVVATNLVSIIPGATLYDFGVLTSQVHNAWMRIVAGRLESRYRYSPKTVYNTFIWPSPIPEQQQTIEQAAQAVLDARDAHPGWSLAQLYDPDKMPADLLAAHKTLDKAVEEAYGVDFDGDEEKIVSHLFKLYAKAVQKQ